MKPVMLATLRPGPVLHVWRDGREVAQVPLDRHAALALAEALLRALREGPEREGEGGAASDR